MPGPASLHRRPTLPSAAGWPPLHSRSPPSHPPSARFELETLRVGSPSVEPNNGGTWMMMSRTWARLSRGHGSSLSAPCSHPSLASRTSLATPLPSSHLLLKMGTRSWQENCGGYCSAVIHIVWPFQSINLSAHAWSSWSCHGYYVEARALGACGYVLVSSFLIRENILALITVNIHASLTYILAAAGVNTIPSMDAIYVLFGTLLLLNCGFFVFLLHIMYTIFLTKLGIKPSLRLPRWLDKAI